MEKTPILSVIMPAYNVEAYIRQAVESALRQSWNELEIIVVDEWSPRIGTMETLHDIDDHRLRRIWQAHAWTCRGAEFRDSGCKGGFSWVPGWRRSMGTDQSRTSPHFFSRPPGDRLDLFSCLDD